MLDGKKGKAEKILYDAFDIIKEKTGEDPMKVFEKALENIKPQLEVKSRRVGGSNYQVPIEVNAKRSQTLGLRWLVNYARLRGGNSMALNLAKKLLMLPMKQVEQLRKEKILIEWLRLIKLLHIIVGRKELNYGS